MKKEDKEKIMNKPSSGLGDTIEKITTATGIKSAVDFLSDKLGFDCNCEKRKEALNKLFSYRKIECLTEDEYKYLELFFAWERNAIDHQEKVRLLDIYNRIFNDRKQMTSCSTCWVDIINQLRTVYSEYKDNTIIA